MTSTDDEWIRAEEAVEMLGLSIKTLYRRIHLGDPRWGNGRSGSRSVKLRTT